MGVQLTKDSVDLGIVVRDSDAMLAFYRDLLGLTPAGDGPMPGNAHMWRLQCGTTVVKLLKFERTPEASAPPGGIPAATGYRYFTISVSNLAEITEACRTAGHKVLLGPQEIYPGTSITLVLDPEGNTVEFLHRDGEAAYPQNKEG